ncbi:sensor histidine kinase [Allofournierella sp.]|uniref:sensor histidine kinase n=1 Tax=Allofournierella sp. TaxID=1940256 RepID=UPI003AB4E77A
MNSITKRWLRGSLLITLLMVAAAVGIYIYAGYTSYYSGARQAMMSRISSITGQLKLTGGSSTGQAAQNRSQMLYRMVEQFDAKDKFEFMLLDSAGRPLATSSGATLACTQAPADFVRALESSDGTGEQIYTTSEGERVMAVTSLVPYASEDAAAMRMITSLTLIDQALARRNLLALGLGTVVVLFSVWSGLFFVRSIVKPVGQIEAAATAIARGDLAARLPEAPYDDEIGRLCGTINQMAEELSKTERMQSEFISSVSHELRTPLTSIRGWVETIAQIRDPEDENYRKGLSIIGRETERLYGMVEELLSFSRLESGVKLDCKPLDLVAELTDAALFVQARMQQEGLTLEYEEPELPLPIWADPGRLRQVFVNVLDNAIKYSLPGGAIAIDLLQDGENAYVLVRDQGRGISPEDLENVKLKFFKGKGAVRGSGIGLAVVDEIMTALDGSVDLASELGKGTTVTLRLPLYRRDLPGRPQGAPIQGESEDTAL